MQYLRPFGKLFVGFFVAVVVVGASVKANAQIITLATSSAAGQSNTVQYVVVSNQVAQLLYSYCSAPNGGPNFLTVSMPGAVLGFSAAASANGLIFAGPATITVRAYVGPDVGETSMCTFSINSTNSGGPAFNPSTAVVIPSDSAGPVNIILQSSVDLINWSAALPGLYGTSTTNRFFRVVAQIQ